jgi:hypothetical protein
MHLLPLLDTLENTPVWLLAMNLSASLTVMNTRRVFEFCGSCVGCAVALFGVASHSSVCIDFAILPRFYDVVVDCTPLGIWRRWPILVEYLTPM